MNFKKGGSMQRRNQIGGRGSMRTNGCRRDRQMMRAGGRLNPYCRRDYLENDTIALKHQAEYHKEALTRINCHLEHLTTSSESSD